MGSYSAGIAEANEVPTNIANDIINESGRNFRELFELYSDSIATSPFDGALIKVKGEISGLLSNQRRASYINQIGESSINANFIGFNLPEFLNPITKPVYQPAEMVHIYQNSTVNLDLKNGQSITGCNMRAYEIMASKAVLACPFNPDFDPHGELEGDVYLKFENIAHLQEIISELNSNRRKKAALCRNARNYCVENHSWDNRLSSLLQCVQSSQAVTI
jgi:hypothetical protein